MKSVKVGRALILFSLWLAGSSSAQNLLSNPDFNIDTSPWSGSIYWNAEDDVNDSSMSGSGEIPLNFTSAFSECVTAPRGTYELTLWAKGDNSGDSSVLAWSSVGFYSSEDCTGEAVFEGGRLQERPLEWIFNFVMVRAPVNARSAVVSFIGLTTASGFLRFDGLFFGPSTVFGDGFESGDLSAWSLAVDGS